MELNKILFHKRIDVDVADVEQPDDAAIDARIAELNPRVREELSGLYGDQLDGLLARVQKFVDARPRLKALLGRRHLGSDPEIVRELTAYVRRTNYR